MQERAAVRIHAYTPQEINMYRNITCCEAKGNEIAPKGTKSNPPTGTGDAGFTFNNEFNAMSDTGILCAYEFIRYNPFHDAPEEQVNNTDVLCEILINMEIGLAVVGGVALLAGYAAAVFFSGGAAAVYAPYVVGGLSFLIGSTAVYGVAVNDCERGEASSKGTYVITGALKALEGAVAGATICMVPGYAAGRIGMMFPGGLSILNVYISAEKLVKIAMAGAYTVSSVNAAIKVNDEISGVVGENAVRDTIGAEKYDMIRETSAVLSNLMFIDGILHPEYQKGNNQQGVVGEGGSEALGVGNPVAVEGRGNTGRNIPNTLNEQMAMNQVQSNPLEGATKVPLEMSDPRWPASDGWVKMQSVVEHSDGTRTTIHYVYNEITGAFDDFKFK